MRGYRGFLRELGHTGSPRALALQLRVGLRHLARQMLRRRPEEDPVERFHRHFRADGIIPFDAEHDRLAKQAQACLVCGLCSIECARVGGKPPLDPRDAVVSASRLSVDWRRLGLSPAEACAGCRACEKLCPSEIPIAQVQQHLSVIGDRN